MANNRQQFKAVRSGRRCVLQGIVGAIALAAIGVASASGFGSQVTVAGSQIYANSGGAPDLKTWRKAISRTPLPGTGCFHASYPNPDWQQVQCVAAPQCPIMSNSRAKSQANMQESGVFAVGGGSDYSAAVTSGSIASAEGTFVRVAGVTSETGSYVTGFTCTGGTVTTSYPDTFSLQLNTNLFTTATCSATTRCMGWEQFILSNTTNPAPGAASASGFIQYWLIGYLYGASACPSGWTPGGAASCFLNSKKAVSISVQAIPITDLGDLTVTGNADVGGMDSIVVSVNGDAYSASGTNSLANLETGWQSAEFNVFGDGGGGSANFNAGSTIVVKTSVNNGTTNAATCLQAGTTAETNNLSFVTPNTCCPTGGAEPAIEFTESNATGVASACTLNAIIPMITSLLQ
jgi:hypothetical protein